MLAAEVNGGAAVGGFPANFLGAPLTLAFADSAGSPVQGMRALHTLRSTHGAQLLAVIGDINDEVTVPLSLLASQLGVPLISPGARSPSLSLKRDHPLFARTIPSEDLFALLWAAAMPLLSWFRVALITLDDDNGRGFADLLLRSTSAYTRFDPVANATVRPFELTTVVLPAAQSHLATSALAQTLDQLYESGVRIFALHAGQHNERVLRMAHERGMVGTGPDGILRQWAGQFCTEEIATAAAATPEMLLGTICNTPPVPRVWPDLPLHAGAVDFENRIHAFDPLLFPADRHITHLDVATGTALFTFIGLLGSAFANPALSNSGADVMGQLRGRGMVVLQADGQPMLMTPAGDAIVNPDIQCWNLRARRFVVGGVFDLQAQSFNMTTYGITYVTGGTEYPKDRDRVYVTGDVLPQSIDGKIVVLAFVVIVLGAWTALILLEQALSFWSRGIWLHAVGWVALAALAFGSASVWPNGDRDHRIAQPRQQREKARAAPAQERRGQPRRSGRGWRPNARRAEPVRAQVARGIRRRQQQQQQQQHQDWLDLACAVAARHHVESGAEGAQSGCSSWSRSEPGRRRGCFCGLQVFERPLRLQSRAPSQERETAADAAEGAGRPVSDYGAARARHLRHSPAADSLQPDDHRAH